jgi:hypothetical protein
VQAIEAILIVVALLSLWPVILGYGWAVSPGYKFGYLLVVLVAMAWVAQRRLARIRSAAAEAKRKKEQAERSGRPPWLS